MSEIVPIPCEITIIPFDDLPQPGRLETEICAPVWALMSALKMVPVSGQRKERLGNRFTMSVKENGHVLSIAHDEGSNQIQVRVVGKAQVVKLDASLILPYLRSADAEKGLVIRFYETDPTKSGLVDFQNTEHYRFLVMQVQPNKYLPGYRIQALQREVETLKKQLAVARLATARSEAA